MIRKMKFYILSAMTLMGMVACSNNDDLPTGPNKPGGDNYSYLSINLQSPQSRTDKTHSVFKDDNVIKKVDFYLIDNKNEVVEVFNKTTDEKDGVLMLRSEQKRGNYLLLAIANRDEATQPKFVVGEKFTNDEFRTYSKLSDLQKYAEPNQFMMLNKATKREGGKLVFGDTLKLNYNTADNPYPVTINVDRAFAAVGLNGEGKEVAVETESIQLPDGYKLLATQYAPFNVYKGLRPLSNLATKESLILEESVKDVGNYFNQIGTRISHDDDSFKGTGKENSTVITENFAGSKDGTKWISPQGYSTGIYIRVDLVDKENKVVPFYVTTDENSNNTIKVKTETAQGDEHAVQYDNGMYYSYFIQDNNIQKTTPYPWIIMRNTSYQVNLTKVNQLGSQEPGGDIVNPENPELPINPNLLTHIKVKVEVNDWNQSELEIEK